MILRQWLYTLTTFVKKLVLVITNTNFLFIIIIDYKILVLVSKEMLFSTFFVLKDDNLMAELNEWPTEEKRITEISAKDMEHRLAFKEKQDDSKLQMK